MHKKFGTAISNNKSTILISAFTSALTILILIGILFALIKTNILSLNNVVDNISTSQSDKVVKTGSAAEESQVIDTVAKANPAVVSIIISKDVPIVEQYSPFDYLFGVPDNMQQNQNGTTEKQEIGGGSGFFVSADGYIVTNNHVISDSTAEYTVMTNNMKKYTAKILASDSSLDVAILKVDGKDFPFLSFADSDTIKLGQTAIAIGNVLAEYQNSISMGIVSGLSRSITAGDGGGSSEQLDGVIQTDAAINPGNSGGPLLDIRGYVIGVNVAIENGAENIGFALPSNTVKTIADSVMKNGEIVKPYLGVRYTQITETVKKENNLTVDYGVIVSKGDTADSLAVIPGSPADKAGIEENDIILEVDGVKLDNNKSLVSIIRQKEVGQTVTLKIIHNGETKDVKVQLEKAPTNI
jgi:S1-C subfamily serine protease